MKFGQIPWKTKLEDLIEPVDSTDVPALALSVTFMRLACLLVGLLVVVSMFLPNVLLATGLFLMLVWLPFNPVVLPAFVVATLLGCCLGRVIQGFFRIAKGRPKDAATG